MPFDCSSIFLLRQADLGSHAALKGTLWLGLVHSGMLMSLIVNSPADQDGHNPGKFIGQRNDHQFFMRTHRELMRRAPEGRLLLHLVRQDRPCVMDLGQVFAEISVPAFADPERAGLVASRHLPWCQTKPGRHQRRAVQGSSSVDAASRAR